MTNQNIIYIDQNIIQYIYEGKLKLNVDSNIIWAYSDEHFGEISRHNDQDQCLEVLEDLRARKIKILLDRKYKITDECFLLEYSDPRILYKDYLDTINDYKDISDHFAPLQVFFYGNTESFDINEYIDQFRSNLNELTADIVDGNESIDKLFEDLIGTVAGQLRLTLEDAKKQIKPIEKTRRTISKNQFSDVKPEQGKIVDQIWVTVKHHFENNSITKDQLFGKEKLPDLDNDPNEKNHTILEGIAQCHTILNYLGYWPDEKLTKVSKIYGINSDASHIAHGFFCNGILSADDRLCRKARAIYEYYGKTNHVFQVVFDK